MNSPKHKTNGERPIGVYFLLVAGISTFALSPILIRYATDAPSLTLAVWRTVFAVLMLAPFAAIKIIPEVRRFDAKDVRLILLAGVLLAFHFVAWIESLYHTSVASASVLVATSPIFLAILGYYFLKERLSKRVVVSILLAVAGSVLIGVGDAHVEAPVHGNTILGNSLAASAALLVSCYLLIGRVMRQKASWLAYVFCLYTVVAVVVVILALARGVPLFGFEPKIYVLCSLMALGPQIIGHGSFNYALKYFPAAILGVLSLTEPIGGSFLAYVLFGEIPTPLGFVGMTVVLLAVAGALLKVKRSPLADR